MVFSYATFFITPDAFFLVRDLDFHSILTFLSLPQLLQAER